MSRLVTVGNQSLATCCFIWTSSLEDLDNFENSRGFRYLVENLYNRGISRDSSYFISCNLKASDDEADDSVSRQEILDEISIVNPRIVVLLGKDVASRLMDDFRYISTARSRIKSVKDPIRQVEYKSLVSYNPTFCSKDENHRFNDLFLDDLDILGKFYRGELKDLSDKVILTATTFDQYKEFCDREFPATQDEFAFDIESNGEDQRSIDFEVTGFSVAPSGHTGIYCVKESLEYRMPEDDWNKCVEYTLSLFNRMKTWVHNIMYERPSILNKWNYDIRNYEDTLIMARVLLGGKTGAGLKDQCQLNLGYPEWEADLDSYRWAVDKLCGYLGSTPDKLSPNLIRLIKYGIKDFLGYVSVVHEIYELMIEMTSQESTVLDRRFIGELVYRLRNAEIPNLTEYDKFGDQYDPEESRVFTSQKFIECKTPEEFILGVKCLVEGTFDLLPVKSDFSRDLKDLKKFIVDYKEEMIEALDALDTLIKSYYPDPSEYSSIEKLVIELIRTRAITKDSSFISYGKVPLRLISRYGAIDSVATMDLKDHLSSRLTNESEHGIDLWKGYQLAKTHFELGTEMELNGLYFNDKRAEKYKEYFGGVARQSIIWILRSGMIDDQIYENAGEFILEYVRENLLMEIKEALGDVDYYKYWAKVRETGEKIPYNQLLNRLGPQFLAEHRPRIIQALKDELDDEDKYPDYLEYKWLFNPSSPRNTQLLDKILVDNDVRVAKLLFECEVLLSEDSFDISQYHGREKDLMNTLKDLRVLRNRYDDDSRFEVLQSVKEIFQSIDGSESILREIKSTVSEGNKISQKLIFDAFKFVLTQVNVSPSSPLLSHVQESVKYRLTSTAEANIIELYDYYSRLGCDIEDMETWSDKFRFIIEFRLYKKCAKLISSYIDGNKVGRGVVYKVKKEDIYDNLPIVRRVGHYDDGPASSDEDYLMQSSWGVMTADTLRWRSAVHCLHPDTEITLADKSSVKVKDLHDRFKSGEDLFVFSVEKSTNRVIIEKISDIYVSGYSKQMIRVHLDNGKYVEVTPHHKLIYRGGEYVEAQDLKVGDSMYPFDLRWDSDWYHFEVYDGMSGTYVDPAYLADEWSERNGCLCDISNDIIGKNGSGCSRHDDLDEHNTDLEYQRKCIKGRILGSMRYEIIDMYPGEINNGEDYLDAHEELKGTRSRDQQESAILKYFDSIDEAVALAKAYNHKVVKVEWVNYEEEIPVYSISVNENSPAYSLSCGIMSKNTLPAGRGVKQIYTSRYPGGIILAPDYCLTGDTKIKLLDGFDKRLDEIDVNEDFYVYSMDDAGQIQVGHGHDCRVVRTVNDTVKLTLSDGSTIESSPEHQFYKVGVGFTEAQDLEIGDPIETLQLRVSEGVPLTGSQGELHLGEEGYLEVDDRDGTTRFVHEIVSEYNESIGAYSRDEVISRSKSGRVNTHHKDFNKLNNRPRNIDLLPISEYLSAHAKEQWANKERLYNGLTFEQLMTDQNCKLSRTRLAEELNQLSQNPELTEERVVGQGQNLPKSLDKTFSFMLEYHTPEDLYINYDQVSCWDSEVKRICRTKGIEFSKEMGYRNLLCDDPYTTVYDYLVDNLSLWVDRVSDPEITLNNLDRIKKVKDNSTSIRINELLNLHDLAVSNGLSVFEYDWERSLKSLISQGRLGRRQLRRVDFIEDVFGTFTEFLEYAECYKLSYSTGVIPSTLILGNNRETLSLSDDGVAIQSKIYDYKVSTTYRTYRLYFSENQYIEVAPGQLIKLANGTYEHPWKVGGYSVCTLYLRNDGDSIKVARYDKDLSRMVIKVEEIEYDQPIEVITPSVTDEHNYPVEIDRYSNELVSVILHNDSRHLYVTNIDHIHYDDPIKLYCFEVDKYHNFFTANGLLTHQSQLEIRLAANLSQCKRMLQMFDEGADIHLQTAASVWRKPPEEVTKSERRYSKMCCLDGSTRVKLLDGTTPTLTELKSRFDRGEKLYTYSIDASSNYRIVGSKITDVIDNCYRDEWVEVELDTGDVITATLDHEFILRDGQYKYAEKLVPGDSLMPMYFRHAEDGEFGLDGHELLKDPNGDWYPTHVRVSESFSIDDERYTENEGYIRHHRDFNRLNNNPTNLVKINWSQHPKYHSQVTPRIISRSYVERYLEGEIPERVRKYNDKNHHTLVEFIADTLVSRMFHWSTVPDDNKDDDVLEIAVDLMNDEKFVKAFEEALIASNYFNKNFDRNFDSIVEMAKSEGSRRSMSEWMSEVTESGYTRASDLNLISVQSKVAQYICNLRSVGIEVTEENFDKYIPNNSIPYYRNLDLYGGARRLTLYSMLRLPDPDYIPVEWNKSEMRQEYSDRMSETMTEYWDHITPEQLQAHSERTSKTMTRLNGDEEVRLSQQRAKAMKLCKRILERYGDDLTPENWDERRLALTRETDESFSGPARLWRILEYFDSFDDFVEKSKLYNHEVVRVTRRSGEMRRFYCLTADVFHNFALYLSDGSAIGSGQSFAILYGADEGNIAMNFLDGDFDLAHQVVEGFFDAYPEIKEMKEQRQREMREYGKVAAPLTNTFLNISWDGSEVGLAEAERQAMNYPIQHTGSMVGGYTFYKIVEYFKSRNLKSKAFSFIHDSFEFDVHPDELFIAITKLDQMMKSVPYDEFGLKLKADMAIGISMGEESDMEEVELVSENEGYLTIKGLKVDIDDLTENWQGIYRLVEYEDLESEDVYIPRSDLFMAKHAYSEYIGTTQTEIKRKFHIIIK